MMTLAILKKVTLSKGSPPLVPEIRFCPDAGLSMVMRSIPGLAGAPPGKVAVLVLNVSVPPEEMVTGSRPVKASAMEWSPSWNWIAAESVPMAV